MGQLIIVSGPPGSGKSTTAALVADRFETSALVEGDRFFAFLRKGLLAPWLPEAHGQNTAVVEAAARAAGRLAGHCDVVYDGVIGPWFAETFLEHTGLGEVHYAVLLPPLEVCLERVKTRTDHEFSDLEATESMWHEFDRADLADRHRLRSPASPSDMANQIVSRALDGSLSYTRG